MRVIKKKKGKRERAYGCVYVCRRDCTALNRNCFTFFRKVDKNRETSKESVILKKKKKEKKTIFRTTHYDVFCRGHTDILTSCRHLGLRVPCLPAGACGESEQLQWRCREDPQHYLFFFFCSLWFPLLFRCSLKQVISRLVSDAGTKSQRSPQRIKTRCWRSGRWLVRLF